MTMNQKASYGGAYVPDCFQGILAEFENKLTASLPTLKEELTRFVASASAPPSMPVCKQSIDGVEVMFYDAMNIDWYVAASWLLLARHSGCSGAVAGFNRSSFGTALAWAASELDFPVEIVASRTMSQNLQLIRGLRELGAQVNTDKCKELFDEPSMYAFQAWFGNPNNLLFVPQSGGEGPTPFPAIFKEIYTLVADLTGIDKLTKPLFSPEWDLLALCSQGTLFIPSGVRRVEAAVFGCLTQKLILHSDREIVMSPSVLEALKNGLLPCVEGSELDLLEQKTDPRLSTIERSMLSWSGYTPVFVKEWL